MNTMRKNDDHLFVHGLEGKPKRILDEIEAPKMP